MKLVLAEKPQVARDLARVLKVPTNSGNGCFEGPNYVITWCIGHLVELEEPAAYDAAWRRWSFSGLPMLPERFALRPAKGTLKQWRVVRDLLRRRDFAAVINACDAGREGELIFRFCYELAGSRLPIERLWISSLTEQAIQQGLRALRPGGDYAALADAARCRAEADWLVGMNATRAVTLKRRETQDVLCSIGRVQTPTLALLVRRERQILAFVPQDYFEVHADLRPLPGAPGQAQADDESFVAVWHLGKVRRLCPRDLADEVARRSAATAAAGPATLVGPLVEHIESRTVREPPPLLFDLTSLQRTANRRFGLSAQRTLEVAQALYERHKLITYPRTDSRHLTADLIPQLPQIFRAVAGEPVYAPLVAPLLSAPPPPPPRVFRESKVSDHHAIIPTQVALSPDRLAGLTREERHLLDLIIRRFLGAFYPDAVFEQTRVVVRVGAPAPAPAAAPPGAEPTTILGILPPPPDRYEARGRVRVQAGWQQAAGISPDRDRAREGERPAGDEAEGEADINVNRALPKLAVGQALRGAFRVEQKQTQPPPRYSEATLLSAMETAGQHLENEELMREMKDVGLGTPATRASIIETLIDRSYVERQGKVLHPTPLGVDLIDGLPVPSLSSPELTGRWEARLARIARGEEPRASFMADIAAYIREIVTAVRAAPAPAAVALHTAAARPAGGRASARGRGRGQRTATARGQRTATARGQRTTTAARGQRTASTRVSTDTGTGAVKKTRTGKVRGTRQRAAPSTQVAPAPVPDAPLGAPLEPVLRCPRCGQGHLITGRRGWGCSGYRQGCALVVPFEVLGRRLSEEDLRALVTLGATGPLTFHPPGGGPVRTRLRLSPAGSPLGFVYLET
jgi:DNA topoisomerase-3